MPRSSICGAIARISEFAADFADEVEEIDVNPLLARPDGAVALVTGGGRGIGAAVAQMAAVTAMQTADLAPTTAQKTASRMANRQAMDAVARWGTLKGAGLATVNAARRAAGQSAITLPGQ